MIDKIRIICYKNGERIAHFNTYAENNGHEGQKVKHYVYQDKDTRGFWHERHYLVSSEVDPVHTYECDISDRVFWGKVRLIRHRDACLPETWGAIAMAVEEIERIIVMKEES